MNTKNNSHTNWRALLPNVAGNSVEYYNIFLFTFLTSTFTKNFIPHSDKTSGIAIYFFIIYFLPNITGILGAYLLGTLGDKESRKKALNLSISGMALCSILISILPTYQMIGILAPILLFTIRSIQVFCAAGEYNGGIITSLEHASKKAYGSVSGIYCSATATGIFLASIVSALIYYFGEEYWRLSFIASSLLTILVNYYRRNIPESPIFTQAKLEKMKQKINPQNMLSIIVAACFFGISYGLVMKILPIISGLQSNKQFLFFTINIKNSIILFIYIIFLFISGLLCNKFQAKKIMICSCISSIFISIFSILFLNINNFYSSSLIEALFLINTSFFIVPFHLWTISLFQVQVRYRSISISYTAGRVISNLMPTILIFLWDKSASLIILLLPILTLSILSIFAILKSKEVTHIHQNG